jgi:hypothetical protein
VSAQEPTPDEALAARTHERCPLTGREAYEFYRLTATLGVEIAQEAVAERAAKDRRRRWALGAAKLAAFAFVGGLLGATAVGVLYAVACAAVAP